MAETTPSGAIVVGPDAGPSYWQPVPANGHAEVKLSLPDNRLSGGVQVIAVGGHIREHLHDDREELLFFYRGEGVALVDGVEHTIGPGSMVFLPAGARHKIINTGLEDLHMMWAMLPGGLEDFFAAIGRERQEGDAAPVPFARPDDSEAIEAATVFGRLPDGHV